MGYKEIDERKIKYSDDVYYLNFDVIFELWLKGKIVKTFDNIKEVNQYLFYQYIDKKPARRVYVYTVYFDEIFKLYYEFEEQAALNVLNLRNREEPKAFRVFGGITYKDAKYYLGTDKVDNIKPSNYCELIQRFHVSGNIKSSFTTSLKDTLLNEDLLDFGSPKNLPLCVVDELYQNTSLAPIIYSETNKEFQNVYCYDFDSAYISLYFKYLFPYRFIYVGNRIDSDKEHFVRVKFINIRAKNPHFLPLSVADRKNGKNIKFIAPTSKRVLMGEEVVVSIFYKLEMELIKQYYEFDDIIIEQSYEVEMKQLPRSFLKTVLELYKTKEAAKHNNEPYADKKVLLNRIHGFFLTAKKFNNKKTQMYKSLPVQIGFYTIALQRVIMCNLMSQIGLNNIVSAHTDSIKTKKDFVEIINKYNEKEKLGSSDTLGLLEFEGKMEKVVYFSNTRAKYIMDGEFHIKHGGIDYKTAQDIIDSYTYDTLSNTSPYEHTLDRSFEREGNKNILYRTTETRIFSDGGE